MRTYTKIKDLTIEANENHGRLTGAVERSDDGQMWTTLWSDVPSENDCHGFYAQYLSDENGK